MVVKARISGKPARPGGLRKGSGAAGQKTMATPAGERLAHVNKWTAKDPKTTANVSRKEQPAHHIATEANATLPPQVKPISVQVIRGTPANPVQVTKRFTYELPPGTQFEGVTLKGSWNKDGSHTGDWSNSKVAMVEVPQGSGKWEAEVTLKDVGDQVDWRWGVEVKLPNEPARWAMSNVSAVAFKIDGPTNVIHRPMTFHINGARRAGDDVTFRTWFPYASDVRVKLLPDAGKPAEYIPLQRDEQLGWWNTRAKGQWKALEGRPYVYELKTYTGKVIEKSDMYAETMQGEQRGLRRFCLEPRSRTDTNEYNPGNKEFLWFNVDASMAEGANEVFLVLKDEHGRPVNRSELQQRVYGGAADHQRAWLLHAVAEARNKEFLDLWDKPGGISADGKIKMTRVEGAFTTLMDTQEALVGLRYEFQTADGKILGAPADGKMTREHRAVSANDPWDNVIRANSGKDYRAALISEPLKPAPRHEPVKSSFIYQAHVGSFMSSGQNVNRSTFKEMTAHLDYLKELGVTDVQILPPGQGEEGGWGYEGLSSLATSSAYGYVEGTGANKKWVSGAEAMQRFVKEAHDRKMNVVIDVVLNHLHESKPQRWEHDGPQNVYFNRNSDPYNLKGVELFKTDWGMAPAFNRPEVSQFLLDEALYLTTVIGADGLRFDFTKPIVDAGGADMLKNINVLLNGMGVKTRIAEHFNYEKYVTQTVGEGGLEFTHSLYTEVNHKLLNHDKVPSALAQAATRTSLQAEIDVDRFMDIITTDPEGFAKGWGSVITGMTTHDEIGNGARTITVASGYQRPAVPDQWARNVARSANAIGAMLPGRFMIFDGEESLARNQFKWGRPATWSSGRRFLDIGKGWNWKHVVFDEHQRALYERLLALPGDVRHVTPEYKSLSPDNRKVLRYLEDVSPSDQAGVMYDISRRQASFAVRDVSPIRNATPELAEGSGKAERVYTHKQDGVMAFARKAKGGDVLVVTNLSRERKSQYGIPLPPGQWREVFNSDAAIYGGMNFGNGSGTFSNNAALNLPDGGTLIFRRVDQPE